MHAPHHAPHHAPQVSIDLNSQGVDMDALSTSTDYRGPHTTIASPAATSASSLPTDVLGFRPVGEELLERLARGVGRLEEHMHALSRLAAGGREDKAKRGAVAPGVCVCVEGGRRSGA